MRKQIAEAVQRPSMHFVPLKTDDQLDLQALHRVRDRLVSPPPPVLTVYPASGLRDLPAGTTFKIPIHLTRSRFSDHDLGRIGTGLGGAAAGDQEHTRPEVDLSELPASVQEIYEGYTPVQALIGSHLDTRDYEATHGHGELMRLMEEDRGDGRRVPGGHGPLSPGPGWYLYLAFLP